MTGDQIRQGFLEFFQGKGHTIIPSSSLVPVGDPTLLFTTAGMVQIKPYFTGEATPPSKRLTSSQKSFRTTDIDEVGDHKHLTFFEMLGNFSVGDYFKKEAIAWAWEYVTQNMNLPADRLYITIYLDDEEAFQHWSTDIGVPEERIFRYGEDDNWWGPAGNEGPCGPSSEIHYDWGVENGCGTPDCHPNHDCERFVELWNLVFMQFYHHLDGKRTPLPAPSIDTGMGLERAAALLQGKRNLYETDLFWPIVQKVCEISDKTYGMDKDIDYAVRVVAEHGRAATFLISDGVVPGNEGRGYVLRRIIRRAIRYGRRLGLEDRFLAQVIDASIDRFRDTYRELGTNREFILRAVGLEEERFATTVQRGLSFFKGFVDEINNVDSDLATVEDNIRYPGQQTIDAAFYFLSPAGSVGPSGAGFVNSEEMLGALKARELIVCLFSMEEFNENKDATESKQLEQILLRLKSTRDNLDLMSKQIPGELVFRIYDTYGFPPELTAEIARERGLDVDMEGFSREMEAQRERARAAHGFTGSMEVLSTYENLGVDKVNFVGYRLLSQKSDVTALLVDGSPTSHVTKGQRVEVVLKETPFYAESGGQVGDTGTITGPNGLIRIEDTQSPIAGLIIHVGIVEEGDVAVRDSVEAQVDAQRRLDTARNHSSTHLLHAGLRQVLGQHVRQAGSLVAHDRLRFDYSHVSPISKEELLNIQSLVNQKVRDNLQVTTRESSFAKAVQDGALAFFGDRYGDVVRIVEMSSNGDPFSVEVCGGTHIRATGEIGPLFILSDSSIGGGMRRVEAVTGQAAEQLFVDKSSLLDSLAKKLQTPVVDLDKRLDSFVKDNDSLRKRVESLEREGLKAEVHELLPKVQEIDGVKVLVAKTSASSAEAMREMGDLLRDRLGSGVILLAMVEDGRPTLISMVTSDMVSKGLHAGDIVRETAKVLGGGGGGRPEIAQAGGKRTDKLDEALSGVPELVRKGVKR